jgi:hypothetical protein
MIGITEHTNELGIHVIGLDYVADPKKRTPEWEKAAKQGLDERSWRKEYKRDWTVASGLPVYADLFQRSWHVANEQLRASRDLPLIRGWDIGPTHVFPACVIAQLDPLNRLDVLYEIVTWDGRGDPQSCPVDVFADDVILVCNRDYPDAEWIDYADPAGWTPSMTDNKSAVMILQAKGIHPRRGPVTFSIRKMAVNDRLSKASHGRASMLISPNCRMLIEGFDGAYKYEEIGQTGRFKASVEKNAWSHPIDALQYLVGGLYVPPKRERDEDDRRKTVRRDRVTGY